VLALQVRGLVKRFDGRPVVDGIDLELHEGEVRVLLGPNGAGKTTLLRMLLGLVEPDAGSITLLGRPAGGAQASRLEGVAGFVEDPAFYPYLSGRANLELMLEYDRRAPGHAVDEVLESVRIGRHAGERVGTYSTGMRQRLGIAASLLRSPRLLLLDEPTSGLDPAGARDTSALIENLSSQGVAVLVSSHLIGELEHMCDSYTVLRHGRVVWAGTAAELRAQSPTSTYVVVTGDDARALEIASAQPGVHAGLARNGNLAIVAAEESLDAFVVALVEARVAIRRLDRLIGPLESMFFALTSDEVTPETEPIELAERALAAS
jgi:ABC-2 type transport system ATP-binding protein